VVEPWWSQLQLNLLDNPKSKGALQAPKEPSLKPTKRTTSKKTTTEATTTTATLPPFNIFDVITGAALTTASDVS